MKQEIRKEGNGKVNMSEREVNGAFRLRRLHTENISNFELV